VLLMFPVYSVTDLPGCSAPLSAIVANMRVPWFAESTGYSRPASRKLKYPLRLKMM